MAWRLTKQIDPEATLQYSRFIRVNGVTAYLRLSEYRRPADTDGERALAGQMYAAIHGPDFGEGRPIELFEIIGHFEASNPGRVRRSRGDPRIVPVPERRAPVVGRLVTSG